MVDEDHDRYGMLQHPGDPGSFDIFADAARVVGPGRSTSIDPLAGLDVRYVVAVGGSQSAMRLVKYANALHHRHRVIDGYALTVWEGRSPGLLDGPISYGGARTVIRDDLAVPVVVVNSEFEALALCLAGARDSRLIRYWEVAGTPHGVTTRSELPNGRGWEPNTLRFNPVAESAIRHVRRWVAEGRPAPSFPRIEVEAGRPPRISSVMQTGTPAAVSASLNWKCPWPSTEASRPVPGCHRSLVRPDRSTKIGFWRCTRRVSSSRSGGGEPWTPWRHQRPSGRRMLLGWSDGSTACGCRSIRPGDGCGTPRRRRAGRRAAIRTFDPMPRSADDGILGRSRHAATILGGRSCSGISGGSSPASGMDATFSTRDRLLGHTTLRPTGPSAVMSSVLGARTTTWSSPVGVQPAHPGRTTSPPCRLMV